MFDKNNPDFSYDIRLTKRHLASGKINKKDLASHLRSLPDVEDKMEIIPQSALFDEVNNGETGDTETESEE